MVDGCCGPATPTLTITQERLVEGGEPRDGAVGRAARALLQNGAKIAWRVRPSYYRIGGRKEKYMATKIRDSGSAGAVYFLAFVGAAVYYIGQATGFWMGVLGFLKAIVWPAFLIYALFKFFGM